MSTVSKVFVVINLLLGIAFLTVSCVLFAHQDNYKQQAGELASRLNALGQEAKVEIGSLKSSIKLQQDQIVDLRNTINLAEIKVANAERESAGLRGDLGNRDQQIVSLQAEKREQTALATLLANDKKATEERLNIERNARNDAIARIALLEEEVVKLTERDVDKDLRIRTFQDTIRDLGRKSEQLSRDVAYYRKRYPTDAPPADGTVAPPIRGRVEVVDEGTGIVMLSVGAEDQVQPGFTFYVYRDDNYVGQVMVDRVFPNKAAARIDTTLSQDKVRPGDGATTRLGTF